MATPSTTGFMNALNKNYLSLIIWITLVIGVGFIIGYSTKPDVSTWYNSIPRSPLTPPNYVFPIVWTILYAVIGTCGWIIWSSKPIPQLPHIKALYILHLVLNWSWTPLFFHYHLVHISLLVLVVMNILVSILILLSYSTIKSVSILMAPYLLWILFATYLNYYILQHT
ncbi:tryptophan-rich sensory protein [Rickettsiales endosymbiont of Peranema trichophorum]|uniref:TspO/MBR family protein n=1 Tax=Rickettsiales endosymbiont of Peranema trichophorum TaxID=2486577 RepID=UPI0010230F3C|nr:tryptophan-rich sensory protein [Rickettsiales endosymbiont of Peranema trichophorum]